LYFSKTFASCTQAAEGWLRVPYQYADSDTADGSIISMQIGVLREKRQQRQLIIISAAKRTRHGQRRLTLDVG
jgi:hypothetical protein